MEYRHQPRKFLRKFPQLYRLGQQNAPSFQVQSSKLRVDKGNHHSILVLVMLNVKVNVLEFLIICMKFKFILLGNCLLVS